MPLHMQMHCAQQNSQDNSPPNIPLWWEKYNVQSTIPIYIYNSVEHISLRQLKYTGTSAKTTYKTKECYPQLISKTENILSLIVKYCQQCNSPAPKINSTHIHLPTFKLPNPSLLWSKVHGVECSKNRNTAQFHQSRISRWGFNGVQH